MIKPSPTGIIRAHAGATAPTGYLLCDGASYLRADYPALFTIIGTTFGTADASHFNVPNAKGKTFFGYNSADADFNAIGKTGGAKSANLAHSHTGNAHTHDTSGTTGNAPYNSNASTTTGSNIAAANHTHSFTATISNQTASGSDSQLSSTQGILIPYLTLNWIIKI